MKNDKMTWRSSGPGSSIFSARYRLLLVGEILKVWTFIVGSVIDGLVFGAWFGVYITNWFCDSQNSQFIFVAQSGLCLGTYCDFAP